MEYGDIYRRYLETIAEENVFDELLYDLAMEATAETNTINTGNPNVSAKTKTSGTGFKTRPNEQIVTRTGTGNKIMDTINRLLSALSQMAQKAIVKLRNRQKKMMLSDSGFKEKLREREKTVKPLTSIKITSYQYLDQFLDAFVAKLKKEVDTLLGELLREADVKNNYVSKNEILKNSPDNIVSEIIRKVVGKEDISDMGSLFRYLKNMYRGDKKETLYSQGDLQNIIRLAENHKAIGATLSGYMTQADNYISQMKSRGNSIRTLNVPDERKRDFAAMLNKAMKIFNMYDSILEYIYELKVEKGISYRIICQRFYQF